MDLFGWKALQREEEKALEKRIARVHDLDYRIKKIETIDDAKHCISELYEMLVNSHLKPD